MSTLPNKIIKLRPSDFAKSVLQLKGQPLDLEEYKPFELIYNIAPPELVIKAGRQVGKSVSLGGSIVSNAVIRPYFNTLYVAPLSVQTSRFSSTYIDPFLNSPLVKKHYLDATSKKNVFEKSLNNGSRIFLSYAETEQDADRIRGASADLVLVDEVQDVSMDALPILYETMAASNHSFKRLTGTAKTENNTLEHSWKRSNMLEWVVKCTGCNKHSIPNDFKSCTKIMSNLEGPQCVHCGKLLDMKTGVWIAAKPHIRDVIGFHIPQFIIPARTRTKKWKELRTKAFGAEGNKGYSAQKLANEVYGLASGVGGRILTLKEVMDCCDINRTKFDTCFPYDDRKIYMTTIGVDWSTSGSTKSYTVITVLGYDYSGKCYVLYSQRIDGVDILEQVARVEQLYHQFDCSMIGSDRGVGVLQGQLMKQHIGEDKVVMVNYVAAKAYLRWDKTAGYYAADRTMNIDTVVVKAKMGPKMFSTPCWTLMAEFWDDALNLYEEESHSGRRLYRKDEDLTDDWLHSVVFANIAAQVVKGEFVSVDETPSAHSAFDLSQYL
jgi:hypothetical protein